MNLFWSKETIVKLLVGAAIAGLVLLAIRLNNAHENGMNEIKKEKIITINSADIAVEVVETPDEQIRGLSGKTRLGENEGMLFIFNSPKNYSFWMKDMNFAIDIIWIGPDWTIVDITKNALPSSYPDSFTPGTPAKFVLEVPAGWADMHTITKGNAVTLR